MSPTPPPLSPPEAEVIALVADGQTNKEIAAALDIAEHTVERHVTHAMAKLGVTRRAAAAAAWVRLRGTPAGDPTPP